MTRITVTLEEGVLGTLIGLATDEAVRLDELTEEAQGDDDGGDCAADYEARATEGWEAISAARAAPVVRCEDGALVMEALHDWRTEVESVLDYRRRVSERSAFYRAQLAERTADLRLRLARLNAEIARRIGENHP